MNMRFVWSLLGFALLFCFATPTHAATNATIVCNGCSSYQEEQAVISAVPSDETDYADVRVIDFYRERVTKYTVIRNFEPGLPSYQVLPAQQVTASSQENALFNDYQNLKTMIAANDPQLAAQYSASGRAVGPINIPMGLIESAHETVNSPSAQKVMYDYLYDYNYDFAAASGIFLANLASVVTSTAMSEEIGELFEIRIIFKFEDGSMTQFRIDDLILEEDDSLAMEYVDDSSTDSEGNILPDSTEDLEDQSRLYTFSGGSSSLNFVRMTNLIIRISNGETDMECNPSSTQCTVTQK
ncbi:hypothetical protein [Pseudidiomarina aestuarii]|uniref:hypothetical protein n=1 Tax=Pseudidiomarina aestuarii TaxID=624146 RepID=UPI003A980A4E